ncbi:MAG: Uma2 family endonuclease [Acidimicrobiales bacterium]
MALALSQPWGVPFTVDDLEGVPDDGHRYELVDGALLVTPAPNTNHQRVVTSLVVALVAAAEEGIEVLPAPYDWVVGPGTLFQPDIVVARTSDLGPTRLERAPLMVVEVQSLSTRRVDLSLKRSAFEAAGVQAYWLVDPTAPTLTVLALTDGRYVEEAMVYGEESYTASFPFAVTVVPQDLLGPGGSPPAAAPLR